MKFAIHVAKAHSEETLSQIFLLGPNCYFKNSRKLC